MPSTSHLRPSVSRNTVAAALPGDVRGKIRYDVEHNAMEYGRDFVCHREMAYTSNGMRLLAEAYDAAADTEAATYCRREAVELEEIEQREQPPRPPSRGKPPGRRRFDQRAVYREMERRNLA